MNSKFDRANFLRNLAILKRVLSEKAYSGRGNILGTERSFKDAGIKCCTGQLQGVQIKMPKSQI